MTLVEHLFSMGWRRDVRRDAMIAPSGELYPMSKIAEMEGVWRQSRHDAAELDALRMAPQIVQAPASLDINTVYPAGSVHYVPGVSKPFATKWSPHTRLAARLNTPPGEDFGLDYCAIFEGANTTFVFVVKGDKALILEDPKNLFPSDSMVARFRLFQEATS